jgi:FkbM family methyltransferase
VRAADIRREFAGILAAYAPQHLVHVGAHDGEEVPGYLTAGIPRITLVEPLPHMAASLRARYADEPRVTVVEAASASAGGTAVLHIPAKTNMASLIALPGHTIEVPTRRLDEIAPTADAAVVDVQGAEVDVLDAAPWETLRLVMVETLDGVDDPALSPPYTAMVEYMTGRGFRQVARLTRDYDWIQRWAYRRETATGAEVHDVVFAKNPPED